MPTAECRPEAPVTAAYVPEIKSVQQNTEILVSAWMETIARVDSLTAQDSLSFSSYYSKQHEPSTSVSNNVLLPLLEESVNSPAMVRHCVKIMKLLVSKLNPGQFTVITGDQPVYTLGKQIQSTNVKICCG